MSVGNNEKWILVEWGNGTRGIVHSRYLVNVDNRELHAGCSVVVGKRGEQQIATFLARSNERPLLEQILKEAEASEVAGAGPSGPNPADEEPADFSGSASSWVPSDEDASDSSEPEDDETEENKSNPKQNIFAKKDETARERSTKRILTPSHRVNAIIPNRMRNNNEKNSSNSKTRKRKYQAGKENLNNNLPANYVKKDVNSQPKIVNLNIKVDDILVMKNMFKELFKMFKNIRPIPDSAVHKKEDEFIEAKTVNFPLDDNNVITPEDAENELDKSRSEDLNRSDDNVLITNKYDKVQNIQKEDKEDVYNIQNEVTKDEWLPIGSGKTLIHKDKFRKIKWTSYTMATRGLLLAVFPRRTLATHSLTGKRSPAFQNKPAKMCLDPKKVSDIIIEVMDRFTVKENLIRSIITTKCADECKMFRTRMEKKKRLLPKNNDVPVSEPIANNEPNAKDIK